MKKWTTEQINKLRELYPDYSNSEIAMLLGFTTAAVKCKARKIGVMKRQFWSENELEYLKKHYPSHQSKNIADHLNRTVCSVNATAKILGLKKSQEFMNSAASGRIMPGTKTGKSFRFSKGHTSWNKGRKMPPGWGGNTRFKKGNVPHNTKSDGAISIRKSKGRPYVWIRVSHAQWRELHRIDWEKLNGTIPEGFNVQFKDGNSLNCEPENLYIINRESQMLQNSIQRYDPELKSLMRLNGKLKRKIKQYEEQN
jgi:hypothetical protein